MYSRSTSSAAAPTDASTSPSSIKTSGCPSKTVSPLATVIRRTIPLVGEWITCSIFIASMTSELLALADGVALAHVERDDRALHRRGDRDRVLRSGYFIACRDLRRGGWQRRRRRARRRLAMLQHRQRIDRVDFCARQTRRRRGLMEVQPPMRGAFGGGQLRDFFLDEARMHAMRDEIGMLQQGLEKAQVGGHAFDPELAQRAIGLVDGVGKIGRRRTHDELGQQRVEPGIGGVAGIGDRYRRGYRAPRAPRKR